MKWVYAALAVASFLFVSSAVAQADEINVQASQDKKVTVKVEPKHRGPLARLFHRDATTATKPLAAPTVLLIPAEVVTEQIPASTAPKAIGGTADGLRTIIKVKH